MRKLEITVSGETSGAAAEYLSLATLVGLLRSAEMGANYVNAPILAAERGIRVLNGEGGDAGAYQSLIKVRASSQGGEESHVVTGTVFGRSPRFVRIDDLHLDLDPTGHLLMTRHHDRPGVMGMLGTRLGDAGVNISRLELGTAETSKSSLALAFFSLDRAPSDELTKDLRAVDAIEGGEALLGRDRSQCVVHADPDADPSISRVHAKVWFDGRHWHIEDVHSANGIRVAGEIVSRALLDDGSVVELSQSVALRFELVTEAPADLDGTAVISAAVAAATRAARHRSSTTARRSPSVLRQSSASGACAWAALVIRRCRTPPALVRKARQ